MVAWISKGFWERVARIILRNRILILLIIVGVTVFLGIQWKNMRFTYTEANLLPDHHPVNVQYNKFLETFGEEGNLIVLATKDPALFTPRNFNLWNKLSKQLNAFPEVDLVVSTDNLKELSKNTEKQEFELKPFLDHHPETKAAIDTLKNHLFHELPFYESLLFNKKNQTIRTAVYIDKEIVNTPVRKDFIFNDFIPLIEKFENKTGLKVHVSGMPYIRTLNSQNIIDEIGGFILAALGVTSLIFFFFFRSFRATFISMIVVIIGVMWAFGILGLLHYEITVLTALIPPLIIVIGIPNCIFLINKYQQEVKKHGNQAKSLQRVISKVGNATLMTNATTAIGFASFIVTESKLLKEFGIVASINILAIFILSLLIIPIIYSFMSLPKKRHLKHLNKRWIGGFVNWMEQTVRHKRIEIFVCSLILLVASIIGIYQMKISGSIIEDMPKSADFFDDIRFFEKEFDGIMPLEIMIDTRRKNGVLKLSTLQRMDKLEELIRETPGLSKPISVVNLVKYSKQAYYNGNPTYYQLPSTQENHFILSYAKKSSGHTDLLRSFIDSTGQIARITTFMKDMGTDQMEEVQHQLKTNIDKIFSKDRYDVSMTGKALVFMKGTKYLVKNLVISLSLAILLIAIFMAYMFRSFKMIIISLIPNLFPLIITAGVMGFLGIPIKPSTILVFSIAFGISVDDTIHFLAKYRQELVSNGWKIRRSVFAALRETGVSMFYTSIVLFFGFSVFMTSSFGGTVALGGLVSSTLLFAMLSNLILLPSLLLSLEKSIANKQVLKEPNFDVLTDEDK
ncbi:efflux RND transporter permease subunit [Sinomicrobium weinanense]|uniref:MMPL family transporter n=1 Tax=Sinomicrobium weinanense TaxID=2842200 RepID=A0A926JNN1_9FLAO|nr:MMPL family transporter [Sinomicrobium weinanense]MBC9794539.1 MMPL family transporter [Sinomicrobium weinanense]MBU3124446.1 MMPL family transporter [Sinomicrobium weinanense]